MSIIATVCDCIQVGQNSFRDQHISREFDEKRSIADILNWAKNELGKDHVSISEVQLSEYTGKSI